MNKLKPLKELAGMLLALATLLLASPATSTEAPDPLVQACLNNGTQGDMNMCTGELARSADAELMQTYRSLMEKLGGAGEYDKRAQALLRDAQRAWNSYRDKECAFETSDSDDGS